MVRPDADIDDPQDRTDPAPIRRAPRRKGRGRDRGPLMTSRVDLFVFLSDGDAGSLAFGISGVAFFFSNRHCPSPSRAARNRPSFLLLAIRCSCSGQL
jgi:hypothetical protein